MSTMNVCFVSTTLLLISSTLGGVCGQVNLTPMTVLVDENNPVTLTCAYTGTVDLFEWSKVVGDVGGGDDILEGDIFHPACVPFTVTPDDTKYNYSCAGNNKMSWTIKNINRSNEGDRWTCKRVLDKEDSIYSNIVSITVRVSIRSVSMTLPSSDAILDVVENTQKTFQCSTDGGLPIANIIWYKDNGTPKNTGDDIEIRSTISVTNSTENQLHIRSSTLSFNPSRSDRGNKIYCSARNLQNQTPVISARKPLLNVLYRPDGPPTIESYSDGGTYQVTENQTGTLKCSSTGGNPLATLSWICYNVQTHNDGSTNTTVVSTIRWTATRNTDRTCTCTSSQSVAGSQTVTVHVQILYPPTIPTLYVKSDQVSDMVKVIRDNSLRISCTSSGKPNPNYSWIYPNNTTHRNKELVIDNIQTSSNGQYTCKAENAPYQDPERKASSSSKVIVQVQFAPSTPMIYYSTTSGTPISVDPFNVVVGDSLPVACSSEGQPDPSYTWQIDKRYTGPSVVLSIQRGMLDIKCTANNELKETGSTSGLSRSATATVTMNINYPPDIPNIRLKYGSGPYTNISHSFSVLEGAAFVLDCQGLSKPDPSYKWIGRGAVHSTEFHVPEGNVTRDIVHIYICEVANSMKRTYGLPSDENGKNMTNVSANVLYGPEVLPMLNQSAEEGKPFRYNCLYTPGNPAETSVKWTRNTDQESWNSALLEIVNVSKDDKTMYMCIVQNTMKPTNQPSKSDPKSGYVYLDVKYKASIEEFVVKDHTGHEVTVDEFMSPTLVCNVDSNPSSNIKVLYRNGTLAEKSDTLQLKHQLSNVSCGNIGVYSCTGRNYLNIQAHSTKDVVLLVQCQPQPFGDIDYTVYSAQRIPATLRLSVLAYPIPSSVVWKKIDNTDETVLKNNSQLTITMHLVKQTGIYIDIMQLELKFYNVTQADFRHYKVQIGNNMGTMEKMFALEAEDIPNSPTIFGPINDLIKTTEATIQWKPGFNGGPTQTFVLLYKKLSDIQWKSIYVIESGDVMNYTLTKLESNTPYQVKIYAQNRVGNSSISEEVNIHTLEITEPPGNVGMIVGSAVGGTVVAVLVAVAVIFLLRRRRASGQGGKNKENNGRTDGQPNNEEDDSDDIEIVENAAYISAGDVAPVKPEACLYSLPVKNKKTVGGASGGDIYAQVQKKNKKADPKQKPKKGKGKVKSAGQGDIYENAPATLNEKEYANTGCEESAYEETQMGKTPAKKNVNKDGLIYADLTFNNQQKGEKKLVIIGADDRTPYAQVDFTKKADPLPDSDPE